ncbi:hypothetical protein ABZ402_48270 [Streptomyces mirabilis]|uniref:hypothetical protein n=1 Tax=Streptomyces mirabilis TaxID=68239 RepID=UPI0033C42B73
MAGKRKASRTPAEQQAWEQVVQDSRIGGDLHQTVNVGAATREALRPEVILGHIRELAPEQLDAREAELAELAAFCFGNEPYVWWVAEAWSGKTALLAWFVLHPPDGVDVLHFFVRGGESYWSDSTAFNTWLHAQLTTYLGAVPSDTSDPRQVHAEWRDLLRQALDRAEAAGRRLLLVVDGIDEDQSRNRAKPLPSILSLLPREPDLRVVLAGRPQYDLPTDVTGHPVLTCRGRLLAGSARAASLYREARLELDTLLRSGGQLAKDILGFAVASEGAVSTAEVAELTNTWEHFIRETIVNGGGRALRVTTFPDGGDGFVFTHETLREQAQAFLGDAMLNAYRARVNEWAARYRAAHWPDGTPFFLVVRYGKLLADTGDLVALTDLVLDPSRHALMRRKTGGDGAALTDIVTAQLQWSHQRDPDLASAVRLARTRWDLARPNLHMPVHLPAVWALLGQPKRAVALVDAVDAGGQRTFAQQLLVDALVRVGEYEAASAETEAMDEGKERTSAQEQLVGALLRVGEHEAAADEAYAVDEPRRRAAALLSVAAATLRAGNADLAEETVALTLDDCGEEGGIEALVHYARLRGPEYARAIEHPGLRDSALCQIVEEYAAHGQITEAAALAGEILDELTRAFASMLVVDASGGSLGQDLYLRLIELTETEPDLREPVLETMSRCFARENNHHQVWVTVSRMADPVRGCLSVIDLYVERGTRDQAEGLAVAVARAHRDATPINHVCGLLASAGAVDRAVAVTETLAEADERVWALARIGAQLVVAGDTQGLHVIAEAERLAATVGSSAYVGLAILVARTGDLTATTRFLRIVADSDQDDLLSAAAAIARGGHEDAAIRAIGMLDDPVQRAHIAITLGKAAVAQDRPETARRAALFAAGQQLIDTELDVDDPDFDPSEVDPGQLVEAGDLLAQAAWVLGAVGFTGEAAQIAPRAEMASREATDSDLEDLNAAIQAVSYAEMGDFLHAQKLARSIADDWERPNVLRNVAVIAAERGDADTAIHLAEMQAEDWRISTTLQEVTRALAAAGHLAPASRAAGLIVDPDGRAEALALVADAYVTAGEAAYADLLIASAMELLAPRRGVSIAETAAALAATAIRAAHPDRVPPLEHRLSSPWQRGVFHAELAARVSADHARTAADHARTADSIARSLADPSHRGMVYSRLATAWATIGDTTMVTRMIDAVLAAAVVPPRAPLGDWADDAIELGVSALVQVGQLDQAEQLLTTFATRRGRKVPDKQLQMHFAECLANAGHYEDSIRIADSIASDSSPSRPWNELIPKGPIDHRDAALTSVITIMAMAGGPIDRAVAAADMIHTPFDRAAALTQIARALARRSRPVRARQLLASALTLGEWTVSLSTLVEMAPDVARSVLNETPSRNRP